MTKNSCKLTNEQFTKYAIHRYVVAVVVAVVVTVVVTVVIAVVDCV